MELIPSLVNARSRHGRLSRVRRFFSSRVCSDLQWLLQVGLPRRPLHCFSVPAADLSEGRVFLDIRRSE